MGSIEDEGDAGRVLGRPLQPHLEAIKAGDRGVSVDILGGNGIVDGVRSLTLSHFKGISTAGTNGYFDPGFVLHHRPYTLL